MSYCRWGNNSDVYMYATYGGWCIHASVMSTKNGEMEGYKSCNFYETSPTDALNRLLELQKEGYRVPQCAVDRITQEISSKGK